jgi:hypothetical protein
LKHVVNKRGCDLIEPEPKHIDMGTHMHEGDFCFPALRDACAGVQRDAVPDELRFRFRIVVSEKNPTGSVGAIDFEAPVRCELSRKPQVVEQ